MVQMKGLRYLGLPKFQYHFISHMVQMKGQLFSYYYLSALLYIPHGSDERIAERVWIIAQQNFISHMVQMKAYIGTDTAGKATLYIPHGSDESRIQEAANPGYLRLYIPHGSDER